jgi:hypothetical protein
MRAYQKSIARKSAIRNPKVKITVICEGKVTEPDYFVSMASYCGALVEVNLVVERGAGVPSTIVDKAIALREANEPRDSFEKLDQLWVVFDRDEHPHYEAAVAKAEAAGIRGACSNPCFELWLVLHYRDHDASETHREIQRQLKKLMPGYDPKKSKKAVFEKISDLIERAEKRAETLERRRARERNAGGNPSTSVYKLTREIRKHGDK